MRFSCRSSLTPTRSGGGMALLLRTFLSNRVLSRDKVELSQAEKCVQPNPKFLRQELAETRSSESSSLRTRGSRLQRSTNLRFDCGTRDFANFKTRVQTITFSKPGYVKDQINTSVKYRCFYQRSTCEKAKSHRDQLSLLSLRKKI